MALWVFFFLCIGLLFYLLLGPGSWDVTAQGTFVGCTAYDLSAHARSQTLNAMPSTLNVKPSSHCEGTRGGFWFEEKKSGR